MEVKLLEKKREYLEKKLNKLQLIKSKVSQDKLARASQLLKPSCPNGVFATDDTTTAADTDTDTDAADTQKKNVLRNIKIDTLSWIRVEKEKSVDGIRVNVKVQRTREKTRFIRTADPVIFVDVPFDYIEHLSKLLSNPAFTLQSSAILPLICLSHSKQDDKTRLCLLAILVPFSSFTSLDSSTTDTTCDIDERCNKDHISLLNDDDKLEIIELATVESDDCVLVDDLKVDIQSNSLTVTACNFNWKYDPSSLSCGGGAAHIDETLLESPITNPRRCLS